MNHNLDPANHQQPVAGAFEFFEGNREELITLTRHGRLMQPGDYLPQIDGIELNDKPIIIHTVNAFGTETCDTCTDLLETFQAEHPEITVYSLTKQSPKAIAEEDQKADRTVNHTRLTIDEETAIDLGVALAPGEGADTDFWPTALRRTVAVADATGRVVHIQQHDDQEEMPNFFDVNEEVLALVETEA